MGVSRVRSAALAAVSSVAIGVSGGSIAAAGAATPSHFRAHSTVSQQNAVAKARSYLSIDSFSLKGLIGQLKFDGFSAADATYGATHAGANWTKEALQKAKSYLGEDSFSFKGLIAQLRYDGFTTAQATYGVTHSGANWFKEAAKKAKSYMSEDSFSASGLLGQLEYDGFTPAQARYGVKAVGL